MASRLAQIARLRKVAIAALAEFPLPPGRVTFIAHGENTTFRHDSAAGRHLIRVHRPQRHGRHADPQPYIRSEFAWLLAIQAQTDLHVPQPIAAVDGSDTVTATAAGLTRVVGALTWADGRICERSPRAVHLARLGAAMARLHRQADAWTPPADFTRIIWNHETFFGDIMVYGAAPAAEVWPLFPVALRRRFETVRERLAPIMAADTDTALIHADLHLGNAVFSGGEVALIDFDDSGFGPRAYDVAVALWELRLRPDYHWYRDALVDAYEGVRDIDLTHLDDYIALRQAAFELWFTGMAQSNPTFAKRLDAVHEWSHEVLTEVGY